MNGWSCTYRCHENLVTKKENMGHNQSLNQQLQENPVFTQKEVPDHGLKMEICTQFILPKRKEKGNICAPA